MLRKIDLTKHNPIVLALTWLLFFGGLAGLSYWNDLRSGNSTDVAGPNLQQTNLAAEKKLPKYETKPIGEIRPIVDWVLADNPEITEDRRYVDDTGRYITDFGPIDPPNWRIVHFRLQKDDGNDLNMWLGRPLWYFKELGAVEEGARVWMDMAEFGAVGNADVVSIAQCPQPPPRPSNRHHLVTGRFVHSSSEFLRLTVERLVEPIDATAKHPFWSEDRQAFVEAGDLIEGERFRLADNSTSKLAAISQSDRTSAAFNLEIDGQHVYHVSRVGIVVHNTCTRTAFYTQQSRSHVFTHGHAANSPRIAGKSRFRVTEGGQKFVDEVINHADVRIQFQGNGRVLFEVDDLGRFVGWDRFGNPTRGGRVIMEGPTPMSWSTYFPGEVVTMFPL